MSLKTILSDKKSEILENWQQEIFRLYPSDSIRFISPEFDRFANPVGHCIREHTERLFCALVSEEEQKPEDLIPLFDEILKIWAVQSLTPSDALGYLYMLKRVIGDVLHNDNMEASLHDEVTRLFSMIDRFTLIAFDVYTTCREKIFELKAETIKNQVSGVLRRYDLVCECPEW
jgi:hypothetical protein